MRKRKRDIRRREQQNKLPKRKEIELPDNSDESQPVQTEQNRKTCKEGLSRSHATVPRIHSHYVHDSEATPLSATHGRSTAVHTVVQADQETDRERRAERRRRGLNLVLLEAATKLASGQVPEDTSRRTTFYVC